MQKLQQALVFMIPGSMELTPKHLLRIARYDRRGTLPHAIPIINNIASDEAQALDRLRVTTRKTSPPPLPGSGVIPVTTKSS